MALQRPEFQQGDLDMEQVRVRIGDDAILVSWHLPVGRRMASVTARKACASPTAAGSSSVATGNETEPELPSP
jgi:hypothetical protein